VYLATIRNDVRLRLYTGEAADAAVVSRMCEQFYLNDPGVRVVTKEDIAATLAQALAHPDRLLVVLLEHEAQVIGYAFIMQLWSNELGGLIAFVDELFVEERLRGGGISTAFFEALPTFLPLVAIDLEVTPKNIRARQLYERLGFKPQQYGGMRKRLV
jgi:GNAT superfamily N-acetyltransferase